MILWRKTQSRTYIFLALMVLFGSVGNILLSKGMKEVGEVNQWSTSVLAAAFFKILTSVGFGGDHCSAALGDFSASDPS